MENGRFTKILHTLEPQYAMTSLGKVRVGVTEVRGECFSYIVT